MLPLLETPDWKELAEDKEYDPSEFISEEADMENEPEVIVSRKDDQGMQETITSIASTFRF